VLDVGAGYGRLAHRLCSWSPRARVVATDAVPLSTFLCEYYLGYRGCANAQVCRSTRAGAVLARGGFDLAVNVHSFGEAPRARSSGGSADRRRGRAASVHRARRARAVRARGRPLARALRRRARSARLPARRPAGQVRATPTRCSVLGAFPAWYHAFELG
jgi:hypothetical protein